jgi:hypothetical protein
MSNHITRITKEVLLNNKEARDNMMMVAKAIHDHEMSFFGISKKNYYDYLFTGKFLSSIKTIDRVWRRVQEDHENLRGKEWEERQIQSGQIKRNIFDKQPSLF